MLTMLETNLLKILFIYRGEGREKEGERNIDVLDTWMGCLTHPQPGIWPAARACALGIEPATLLLAGCHSIH